MTAASASATTIPTATPVANDAHDGAWDIALNDRLERPIHDQQLSNDTGKKLPNGGSPTAFDYGFEPLPPSRKKPSVDNISMKGPRPWDRSNRSSDASAKPFVHDETLKRAGTGDKRTTSEAMTADWDDESSKWIHRDKLAKIESQELQAAGIVLPPRSRASSRPRKGRSQERPGGLKRTPSAPPEEFEPLDPSMPASVTRNRNNSAAVADGAAFDDGPTPAWDLRLPEEIEAEGDGYWVSSGSLHGGSKIPVAKVSPAPIPEAYIDRPSPSSRRQSDATGEFDSITYPKTRSRSRSRSGGANALTNPPGALQQAKRSATDISPKKQATTGTRKTSAPAKTNGSTSGRPKTRSGIGKDLAGNGGTARPSTRSGELSPTNKQPEGDPPWMIGSYKPDPRLPPDQQLLPTVARRLQQEKWEKEGKFGSIYDKEFRPLTDEGLLKPPEAGSSGARAEENQPDEWPLKPEQKSPALKQGTSYSTIPKISEKPPGSPLPSPLASPRSPGTQSQQASGQPAVSRVPDAPDNDDEKKKDGCGCCVVM